MSKKIDLTDKRYDRLTVLREAGKNKHGQSLWKCHCECGQKVIVLLSSLTSGRTKSCGCLRRELVSQRSKSNLVGHKFGRLMVLREAGSDKHKKSLWECICECGNKIIITSGVLKRHTKSCGCLRREMSSLTHKLNLIGSEPFGRLTVLRESGRNKHGQVLWECQCECGVKVIVASKSLISGHTKSCGCWNREVRRNSKSMTLSQSIEQFGYLMDHPADTVERLKEEHE